MTEKQVITTQPSLAHNGTTAVPNDNKPETEAASSNNADKRTFKNIATLFKNNGERQAAPSALSKVVNNILNLGPQHQQLIELQEQQNSLLARQQEIMLRDVENREEIQRKHEEELERRRLAEEELKKREEEENAYFCEEICVMLCLKCHCGVGWSEELGCSMCSGEDDTDVVVVASPCHSHHSCPGSHRGSIGGHSCGGWSFGS